MLHARPTPLLFLLLLLTAGFLGGCATTAPPAESDLSAIDAGEKVLLLLRVATSADGQAQEPFSGSLADDNVGIGLGTFDTGGTPRQVEFVRFFSEESRAQGWTYMLVQPSTIYLAFLPFRQTDAFTYLDMFKSAQPWRVDLPTNSKLVYAGTLAIEGEGVYYLGGGGKKLRSFTRMEVRDEREEAQAIANHNVPGLGPIETVLMQRHDGPIILTTPTN